jgi:rSAM/selenodomain-associated transferase 1
VGPQAIFRSCRRPSLGNPRVSRCAIAVMARAPSSPGKTRLSPYYSESRLRALRAALLADALHVVAAVPEVDHYIFFTPDDAKDEISAIAADRFELVSQRGDDLGQRMEGTVKELLVSRGCAAALLVGSDIPTLDAACFTEARATLESNGGVVIGPADDGGYYLIGMRELHAELFRDIEWGTAGVLNDTLRAAARAGVEARLIRGGFDIDTMEDLRRLEWELKSATLNAAPNLRRWLDEGG